MEKVNLKSHLTIYAKVNTTFSATNSWQSCILTLSPFLSGWTLGKDG